MIRNLRILALMMGVVSAVSGLTASSATAQTPIWLEGEAGIQTITAAQEEGTTDKLSITNGAKDVTCEFIDYENETSTFDSTESEVELTPEYSNCSLEPFVKASINMNGCDYRIFDLTTDISGTRTGSFQIQCPEGNSIEIETSLVGTFKCTITVPPQVPSGHVAFANLKGGEITMKMTLSGIHYIEDEKKTNGTASFGSKRCEGTHTGTDGTYEASMIVRGRTHAGVDKEIWIDLPATSPPIWFEGEAGIQTITAEQEPETVDKLAITSSSGSTKTTTCTHIHYTSETATVDTTESEIELTPTYSGCTVHPFGSSTVGANGCDYRFYWPRTSEEGGGGQRTANFQITCPASKHIEIEAKLFGTFKCTITIGGQTPSGHVIFTNTGAGSGRDVTVKATIEKIKWTEHDENTSGTKATGIGACADGAGEDGTWEGVSVWRGRDHAGNAKGIWVD